MNLGKIIKQLRQKHNMTQEDLGKIIDKNRSTIAGYETEGKEPDYDTIKKIAIYFNVSTDYLLGKTDTPEAEISDKSQKLSIKIHDLLIEKGVITKDEELTEEKIEWLQKLLGHAIDLSKL